MNGISTSFFQTQPYIGGSSGSSFTCERAIFATGWSSETWWVAAGRITDPGETKLWSFGFGFGSAVSPGDPPWVTMNPSRRLPQVEIGGMNGGIKNQIHGSWNRGDLWSLSGLWECRRGKHACALMAIYSWHGSWWLANMHMYISLKGQWRRFSRPWNKVIGNHTVEAAQRLVLENSIDCQLKPSCASLLFSLSSVSGSNSRLASLESLSELQRIRYMDWRKPFQTYIDVIGC